MEFFLEIRSPAVAGYFYPMDPDELRETITSLFKHPIGPGKLPEISRERKKESLGFVVPHAGYIYSGPVAAHSYYYLAQEGKPDTFIIIGPNHTGYGALLSVYPKGKWATPFGEIEVDEELARAIVNNSNYAELDYRAHIEEHSIEVQLPFLQFLYGNDFKIVPIAMALQTPEVAKDLARSIFDSIAVLKRDIVLIASSDFTHYEPHDIVVKKDLETIKAIEELDLKKFYNTMQTLNVTACGPGGIMTLMEYSLLVCKEKAGAKLLKYATSGDTSGDRSAVVGYAAIRFFCRK